MKTLAMNTVKIIVLNNYSVLECILYLCIHIFINLKGKKVCYFYFEECQSKRDGY